MNHRKESLKLMSEITNFLKDKNKNYDLWSWAIKVPLVQRIEQLFSKNKLIQTSYENDTPLLKNGIVLDLGCGFCPYWPFLNKMGYNKFVGVDLYSKRGYGAQEYMKTASQIADNFCSNIEYMIIEDDVRNISNYSSRESLPNVLSKGESILIKENSFDLIFTKNTNYKKVGSTGIPPEIFDDICNSFLSNDGIKMYAG